MYTYIEVQSFSIIFPRLPSLLFLLIPKSRKTRKNDR